MPDPRLTPPKASTNSDRDHDFEIDDTLIDQFTKNRISPTISAVDNETNDDVDAPLPEKRRSRLLSESLHEKAGNYVLTFGFPGSGKTTFHSFLVRYLMEEGPFRSEFVTKNDFGEVDYDINRMVTNWKSEWRSGRFPAPTPVGEEHIRELRFDVTPLQGVRIPLQFNLLEVSGETLKEVLPTEHRDPVLARVLFELLSNEKIKFIIILLLNPAVHDNDDLFVNFLSYMDTNLPFNIRQRASLGIVVSKPGEALKTLKDLRQGYSHVAELRGKHTEDFVESFAKSTYRIWYDWPDPKKKMISRLYLGEIEDIKGQKRLVRPDYQSIEGIFDWMYQQFTGKTLGPTWYQKIARLFHS
ncbi:GTP-binding protein [Thiohalocapsa marina]|uniref:GTP-binding protein n=1 Tax=Thiohalocapsa marina TaxID=424902 RepID=A0A5M8FG47_9GAMM|nr:GTP-binding protein [Thiohalocapsa marina]KAA6182746.1 GTP-binding protein [Thiohalocapsa marina]